MVRRLLLTSFLSLLFTIHPTLGEPLTCRDVEGLTPLLQPGNVLLFGEIHGTNQAPAFVADAACLAAAAERRVTVALEMNLEEAERVEAFLASDGGEADRKALLAGPFWTSAYQDGRRSRGMLALLDEVRQLKKDGNTIDVHLFDSGMRSPSGHTRDRAMGQRLRQAVDDAPTDVFLVLTGNVHSRVTRGTPWNKDLLPMGTFVVDGLEGRRVVALNMSSAGGTAWVCQGGKPEDCGSKPMGGRGESGAWKVTVDGDTPGEQGHHGRYHVGDLTASPPAVAAALAGEALITAAQNGDVEAVRKLLAEGADVGATNDYGATALTYAADNGNVEILRLLIEKGAEVNHTDTFYQMPAVMWGAFNGHGEAVKLLVEQGAEVTAALRAGMMAEDPDIVEAVLSTGEASAEELTEALGLATAQELPEVVALLEKAGAKRPPESDFKLPPEALAAFAGSYVLASPVGGMDIDLKVEDGSLVGHIAGQPPLPLEPVDATHFRDRRGIGIRLDFELDGERVAGFQLHQPGAPDPFSAVRKSTEVSEEAGDGQVGEAPAVAEADDAADPEAAAAPVIAAKVEAPAGVAGRDWPAFRGPNAGGTAKGNVPLTWDVRTGDNVLWKSAIPGRAHSSPIVWGDQVFVTTAVSSAPEEPFRTGLYGDVDEAEVTDEYAWQIYALDKADGKVLWHHEMARGLPRAAHHFKATQANATPVTDGKVLVAMMGSEGLFCYDLSGKLLWKKDLGTLEVGWFYNPGYGWGHSSSPIIYRDRVIVQVDRYDAPFVAAYALADGREVWRTARENLPSWGTPTVIEAADHSEIVTNGSRLIRGYDAETGKELWHLGPISEVTVGTPVVGHGMVFVTGSYPPARPIYAIRPGGQGDISLAEGAESSEHIAWMSERDGTYIPTPLVYGDYLYMTANNGGLGCYDARTGERLYRTRLAGRGGVAFSASPVAAGGRLYFASEDGDVYVGKAGPEYELLATNAMDAVVMATPAISGDTLFIRTMEHVYAIGVAADGDAAGSR